MTISKIVEQFYIAFSNHDYDQLAELLSENIIYNDPIFGMLEGEPVFDLWRMRCDRLREFSLSLNNVEELDAEYATCQWSASFFHRPAGKIITMPGKAFMKIFDGKIIEHSDGYKLSTWLSISQGLTGKLLGWTGYMKRKEQNHYRAMLHRYISGKSLFKDNATRSHDYDFSDR